MALDDVLEDDRGNLYYLSQGHLALDSKKYDKAITAYKRALDTSPDKSNLANAYMGLTQCYDGLGEKG